MIYLREIGKSTKLKWLSCILLLSFSSFSHTQENIKFSPSELAVISQFGPWPPTSNTPDLTNSLDQDPRAIELGKKLFFDANLSANNQVSCATCHQPNKSFTDQSPLSIGLNLGIRNTPTLLNIKYKHWYGWSGDTDTLWGASIRALLSSTEMSLDINKVSNYLQVNQYKYRNLVTHPIWKNAQTEQDKLVFIGKLLASYQGTLISSKSEFDLFREALLKQDKEQMSRYSQAKIKGLKLFIGKGNCHFCHSGPLFSNNEFADIGMSYFDREGKVDKGRYQGIKNLKKSPFSSLGIHNDDTSNQSKILAKHVTLKHRNFGEFMVPSLRSIIFTAPYMHQGSLANLDAVIEHYSNIDEERLHTDGIAILKPLNLSAEEKANLKAFLESL
ncbi:hypothetical protein OA92_14780 [Marinomonas sp. SBI22]|uniref:cytochrome-c peroxidase n=1 Tax=unclassified Marinomonas TaxID=196814 RepID=UPI0007AF10D1|nr:MULTISPECIES: cytochrome c peroxidase [unclassified Marinomonas]KZM40856.1 hypothetical protein OA92_14780 [Marinomonas sp. SBI22]KZM42696.1 hypothetical protein OA91_12985 [Marinomonas sp. SBI8L]